MAGLLEVGARGGESARESKRGDVSINGATARLSCLSSTIGSGRPETTTATMRRERGQGGSEVSHLNFCNSVDEGMRTLRRLQP